MNFSRQALLGIGMILGGSVMLYAMVQQIGTSSDPASTPAIVEKPAPESAAATPLTTDIDTEKRILAQKQQERAARVAEQEKRAQQFLAEQEQAEAEALAKARAENQQYIANALPAVDEDSPEADANETAQGAVATTIDTAARDQAAKAEATALAKAKAEQQAQAAAAAQKQADAAAKKEAEAKKQAAQKAAAEKKKQDDRQKAEEAKQAAAAPKSPTDYTVKSGDGLLRLSRQYNVPVEALAQANDLSPRASLQVGQALTIPSRKQIERLEREAAAREAKLKKEAEQAKKTAEAKRDAQQKLLEARQEVKETDAKGSFGVQVSLARNQAAADEVAKKFKSAGYQVKTSATSRGVRVIIGPERGKIAALALKDKINTDPKVDTSGAWVLYW